MGHVTKDRFLEDVNTVLMDAEALLKQAGPTTGAQAQELRERAQAAIGKAKHALLDAEERAVREVRAAGQATDNWVHQHPWTALGIVAGVALVVGLVVNRK
jgi:ElaB/YqjD/DUF883 family membrane-anchored ribosome-binding protein